MYEDRHIAYSDPELLAAFQRGVTRTQVRRPVQVEDPQINRHRELECTERHDGFVSGERAEGRSFRS